MRVVRNIALGLACILLGGLISVVWREGVLSVLPRVHSEERAARSEFVGQPYIPNELFFAGERIPLEYEDVREALDYELCVAANWHSQILQMLKRSTRYFPELEQLLGEEGVPADLKYLAVAESSLNERAYSPSKAAGLWQFLEAAGKEYGLVINEEVDQRYDLERATRAACAYLKAAYARFGSWAMAAAAYNMGQNGLMRVTFAQTEDEYYNLHLNIETGRYFYRILALKLVLEYPERYGFALRPEERYAPIAYRRYDVDSTLDLPAFAKAQGLNYKLLRRANPWLRTTRLTVKGDEGYQLRLPLTR